MHREASSQRRAAALGGSAPTDADVDRLRSLVQTFVRSFGLLVVKETPCGHPISLSSAHALMVLLDRMRGGEDTSQADLASRLGIDKSNVARLCARLEESGHVEQERAPDDGRSRLVRLTAAGSRLAHNIERSSHDRFRRVTSSIPARKRSAVLDSLVVFNAAVESLGSEQGVE